VIIAICGFMGSGKSTFLDQFPEVNSVDLDQQLEQSHGALGDFIRSEGWDKFRDHESESLKEVVSSMNEGLISLGGGTLDRPENIDFLKESKVKILFLEISFEDSMQRVQGDSNRPQLDKSEEELRDLFERREKIYRQASDFILKGDAEFWPTQWNLLKTLL
jgi:shikimate kinase